MKNSCFAIVFLTLASLAALATGCRQPQPQVLQPPDTRDDDVVAIRAAKMERAEQAKVLPSINRHHASGTPKAGSISLPEKRRRRSAHSHLQGEPCRVRRRRRPQDLPR